MIRKTWFALLLNAVLLPPVYAQFFTSCSRQKSAPSYDKQVERRLIHAQSNEELFWVKLVKNEENQVNHKSTYGRKVPIFTQSPIPTDAAHTFSLRLSSIQRAINRHPVLARYELIVPQPNDIITLREWEINHLSTFFLQGIVYGQTHEFYLVKNAKKVQESVVEIQFTPRTSSHTAIFLVDCHNRKIYLFIDHYKNRQ